MKTFSIVTLGCKVNQYESQQIRELLEHLGLIPVEGNQIPDLVVINTCCVTHTASAKSRQYIRKAQRLNPCAVVISGCLPTVQIGEMNASDKNSYIVKTRRELVSVLNQIVTDRPENSNLNYKNDLAATFELPTITSFKGHTRAFLKVQDGCDAFCSYCIVPKTRPIVQSKPIEIAIREARALVDAGHREIVVTGVCLGAYGRKTVRRKNRHESQNGELADLLDNLAKIPDLARIRLSSLEPADVTERLLDIFCKHHNIMPHLHLSLQSGSDDVLKRMCRQYSAGDFRNKVELIKSLLDRPAITTDIIVGFPGETEADFEQTIDLAKQICFAKMHVFPFSLRKGTAAANMKESVDNKIIKKRAKILHDLNLELGMNYRRQFIGETAVILTESPNGRVCGRSERYFMVSLEDSQKEEKKNELLKVKLLENTKSGVIAKSI